MQASKTPYQNVPGSLGISNMLNFKGNQEFSRQLKRYFISSHMVKALHVKKLFGLEKTFYSLSEKEKKYANLKETLHHRTRCISFSSHILLITTFTTLYVHERFPTKETSVSLKIRWAIEKLNRYCRDMII